MIGPFVDGEVQDFVPNRRPRSQRRAQASSRLAAGHRRRRREAALTMRAWCYAAGRGNEAAWWQMRIVAFAADHQLPHDASGLVGESHSGKFGRLAFDEPIQPGRGIIFTSALADLLDHSRGADDQRL